MSRECEAWQGIRASSLNRNAIERRVVGATTLRGHAYHGMVSFESNAGLNAFKDRKQQHDRAASSFQINLSATVAQTPYSEV